MAEPEAFPRDIPPLWFLLAIGAQLLLHAFAPGGELVPWPWTLIGLAPLAAGVLLTAWAVTLFYRRRTGVRPGTPAAVLVAVGPYRVTRNPMYVGLTVALAGGALLLGSWTPWLVVPAFVVLLDRRFVRREERLLAARFGDDYAAFRARVRRWL